MSLTSRTIIISAGLLTGWVTSSFAQTSAPARVSPVQCRDVGSAACRNALWQQALEALDTSNLQLTQSTLTQILQRSDMALPGNEELRANALQLLAAVRLRLQDIVGAQQAGRQALAIWQRRNRPSEMQNRLLTHLNLANASTLAEDFGEAETLAQQYLSLIGPVNDDNRIQHIKATELLATILAGRKGPVAELIRLRAEIVALYRAQSVPLQDAALQRVVLARALINLGDTHIVAAETALARAALSEAEELLVSIVLPTSDPDWVTLRSRYLTLLKTEGDLCGAQAMGKRVVADAELRGGRSLSQALIQVGEIYLTQGASTSTAPLWARATKLELDMACTGRALGRGNNQPVCMGSPLLIDHLHSVGLDLRYKSQARPSAGYRSLVHAGDLLRARTLARYSLNRDASNIYSKSRTIFRDQVTAAWAINDVSVISKTTEQPLRCDAQ